MTTREADRLGILKMAISGKLTNEEAAKILSLSVRQVIRLKGGIRLIGPKFLAHGNRGKPSPRRISPEVRLKIIDLAKEVLSGANCTHMAEILQERFGIIISAKSIGRLLQAAGIERSRSHRSPRRYRRRKRRAFEGDLIQMDASPFAWLGDDGPIWHLHGAIDDATGKIVGLTFCLSENTFGYLEVLRQILISSGIPRTLYTDRHSIFVPTSADKPTLQEQLAGKTEAQSQFGRIIDELGIGHIEALSPQAKGRIERLWGTLQDRLVIEIRLAGIKTLEEANQFLKAFIKRFNRQFTVQPAEELPAWRALPVGIDLKALLACRYERTLSGDSTISWENLSHSLVDSEKEVFKGRKGLKIDIRQPITGRPFAWVNGRKYFLNPWYPHSREQTACQLQAKPRQERPQNGERKNRRGESTSSSIPRKPRFSGKEAPLQKSNPLS